MAWQIQQQPARVASPLQRLHTWQCSQPSISRKKPTIRPDGPECPEENQPAGCSHVVVPVSPSIGVLADRERVLIQDSCVS